MTALIEDSSAPRPFFVLRGHSSEIQCLHFSSSSICASDVLPDQDTIISGDAQGYVIVWSLVTFRPLAVWKAHEKAILSVSTWNNKILTHGRDNKLFMWEILSIKDMATNLPLPSGSHVIEPRQTSPKPFMLCALDVNSINFCQAAFCRNIHEGQEELLVAVPGLIGSEYIDIYTLPSALRLATRIITEAPTTGKLGNVMAIDFHYPLLAVGYENGGTALYRLALDHVERDSQKQNGEWSCLRKWTAHREAVLSVKLNLTRHELHTCGIDSRVISYNIERLEESAMTDVHTRDTKHAGQQSMRIRSDDKLIATAGWDSFARIYTTKKLKEVAVLGYHKSAVNSLAFRDKTDQGESGMIALGGKDSKISLWRLF